MSDMVERVARALCDLDLPQCGGSDGTRLNPAMPNWHHYRRQARAAIEAMRSPTPRMIDAMCTEGIKHTSAGTDTYPVALWQAAIRVALED